MGAVSFVLLALAALSFLCVYFSHDKVHCNITGGGSEFSGYYVALSGSYRLVGRESVPSRSLSLSLSSAALPDVFNLFSEKLKRENLLSTTRLLMFKGVWVAASQSTVHYATREAPLSHTHTANYSSAATALPLFQPPQSGWYAIAVNNNNDKDEPSSLSVRGCHGRLSQSPLESQVVPPSGARKGLSSLLAMPVTSLLLVCVCVYAYWLYDRHVDVSAVSYSHEAVANRGEYWRIFTSSFAHFDLLHLGFNAMGLWQLGSLETIYGSLRFLSLSLSLVVLTMLIVLAIQYVLIHRFSRHEQVAQQAVGYSAVLFAWIVALSVREREFCPIFFFPSFCINTWYLPLTSHVSLPINLSPFVLLIFTKFLIPRSSFIGHLAGILIGYPLAWNALNGLTPTVALALFLLVWVVCTQRFVWRWPEYAQSVMRLYEFVDARVMREYVTLLVLSLVLSLLSLSLVPLSLGLVQLIPRTVLVFLLWSTAMARKIDLYTESVTVQADCSEIVVYTACFALFLALYDFATLLSWAVNEHYLQGLGVSHTAWMWSLLILGAVLCCESALAVQLVRCMQDMAQCRDFLLRTGLEKNALREELVALWLVRDREDVVPFSGSARRLQSERGSVESTSV